MIRSALDCPSTVRHIEDPKSIDCSSKGHVDMVSTKLSDFSAQFPPRIYLRPCAAGANRSLKSHKSSESGTLALSAARPNQWRSHRQGIGWMNWGTSWDVLLHLDHQSGGKGSHASYPKCGSTMFIGMQSPPLTFDDGKRVDGSLSLFPSFRASLTLLFYVCNLGI